MIPTDRKTLCLRYTRLPFTAATIAGFMENLKPHLNARLRSSDFIKDWKDHPRLDDPMCGACVPATQCVFYAFDTDTLVPFRGEDGDGMIHWYCKDQVTGDLLDPTSSQYTDNGLLPPYEVASPAKWYGWKGRPQIRSLHLLNRVLSGSQMYEVDGDDFTPPSV